jgi:Protein of unknown function (DUF559)
MDARFRSIAARAATQHSVVSLDQLEEVAVTRSLRCQWVAAGLLDRLGQRSFAMAGSEPTWARSLVAGFFDLGGDGFIAGRSACRLFGLDGFNGNHLEFLVERRHRERTTAGVVRSTNRPIGPADVQWMDGLRVVRAERLIVDFPLFGFTRQEMENAVDSAIRLRLVSEQRLRTRVLREHTRARNGGRVLLDTLVDSGGESRLERMFLQIVRQAGLHRPVLQKTFRADVRTVARVDAFFPGGLVVEVAGHGTHATRLQRQRDAQRQTELTLRGLRVLTFTYEDVRDRPDWVIARLRQALDVAA